MRIVRLPAGTQWQLTLRQSTVTKSTNPSMHIYMHAYVHINIRIYIYTSTNVHIYIYVNIPIFTHMHVYIHIHTYTYIYIHIHTVNNFILVPDMLFNGRSTLCDRSQFTPAALPSRSNLFSGLLEPNIAFGKSGLVHEML